MKEQLTQLGKDFSAQELLKKWDILDAASPDLLRDILQKAAAIDIFSSIIDEKLGGSGLTPLEYSAFILEVSKISGGVGLIFASHLMGLTPVFFCDNEDRRAKLLSEITHSEGENISPLCALAACENNRSWPDPDQINTILIKREGKNVLSGEKTNVIGAEAEACFSVLAKGENNEFIWLNIDAHSAGISVKKQKPRMGLRICPVNDVVFDTIEIFDEDILRRTDNLNHLNSYYEYFDPALSAVSLGLSKEAANIALKYSTERYQGGKIICEHDAVKMLLPEITLSNERSDALISGESGSILFSANAVLEAEQICLDAIQVLGGYGYMEDYKIERLLRDAKTLEGFIDPNSRKMAAIEQEINKVRPV